MNTMSRKKELQACRKRLCKIDKILYKLEFSIAKKAYKEGKYAVVALKNRDIVSCPSFKSFKTVYKSEYKNKNVLCVMYKEVK